MVFMRYRCIFIVVGLFLGSVGVHASDAHWPALQEFIERSSVVAAPGQCSDSIVRSDVNVEVATLGKLEKRWIKFRAQLQSRTTTTSDLLKELAVFVDYVGVASPTFAARVLGHIVSLMDSHLERLTTEALAGGDNEELFEMFCKAIVAVSEKYVECAPAGLVCFARAAGKEHRLPRCIIIKCREELCRLGELLLRSAEKKIVWLKKLVTAGICCSAEEQSWVFIHLRAAQWLISAKKSKGESTADLERLENELKVFYFEIKTKDGYETPTNRKRPRTALTM